MLAHVWMHYICMKSLFWVQYNVPGRCGNGGAVTSIQVVDLNIPAKQPVEREETLGLVADAGVFTVANFAYIVTAAAFYDGGGDKM